MKQYTRCSEDIYNTQEQSSKTGCQPLIRQVRHLWIQPGRHPHAQKQACLEQVHVHRNDNLGKQQDPDVWLLLW